VFLKRDGSQNGCCDSLHMIERIHFEQREEEAVVSSVAKVTNNGGNHPSPAGQGLS
jgi:hypothetical protein